MNNFLFNIFLVLWTLISGILGLPLLFFSPSVVVSCWAKPWAYVILKGLWLFCGVKYEIRGRENLSSEKGLLFIAKHHSTFETLLLACIIKEPVFILKKELTQIPLFGLYVKATKMIAIDQASYALSFKRMIRSVHDRVGEGKNIIIFPEGGRVGIYEDVDYQRGVSALYADPKLQDISFIPIALNCGLFWSHGIFDKKTPGTAVINILPPVQKSLSKNEFMKVIKEQIDTESAKLVEEGNRDICSRNNSVSQLNQ